MKDRDFQWKQMEWWAFYFEMLCHDRLREVLRMPGDTDGRCTWDGTGHINWDFKAKAIKTDSHSLILNDKSSMDASIEKHNEHGLLICLCDVEYNDKERTFQRWRESLQGGKSDYQVRREQRTSTSRYRKTLAVPTELLFVQICDADLQRLGTMKQGRNSNDKDRPPKYMINLSKCEDLIQKTVKIGPPLL